MRFHANVCPLALGRNVIGLNCYPQIENLYRGLSLTDHLAHVGHPGFSNQIIDLAQQAITAPDRYAAEAHQPLQRVRKARVDLEPGLQNWLETALV